jgi:transposase
VFKESKVAISKYIKILADSGYQGIAKIHLNSEIPVKKKRGQELTEEQKAYNHELSSKRIVVENVFAMLKRFRILGDKYRNRRKRFGLRFNLIAGLYNWELDF